jgi:hypothetical protein
MKHKVVEALLPLLVEIDSLALDPANAREGHDVAGIAASLREFGQRTPLVALNNGTGRLLKGNGTLRAACSLGWTHVAAILVEDDATTATRYAIADNRLGDKSHFSLDALGKLLDSLDEPESVPGADEDWLEEVRALSAEPVDYDDVSELWEGMPEFEQEDLSPYQTIKVHFASEGDRESFAGLIGQHLTENTKSVWYPLMPKIIKGVYE